MINIDDIVERDEERYGNYYTKYLMFPFPEESVLQFRKDEEMRYQMKKSPLIAFSQRKSINLT